MVSERAIKQLFCWSACIQRTSDGMKGLMQDYPLVVTNILDYAAKFHSEQLVITCTAGGSFHRYTYLDMHRRSQQCALALQRLGVRSVLCHGQKKVCRVRKKARLLQARKCSCDASVQHVPSHGMLVRSKVLRAVAYVDIVSHLQQAPRGRDML